jgi:hypothetical protein
VETGEAREWLSVWERRRCTCDTPAPTSAWVTVATVDGGGRQNLVDRVFCQHLACACLLVDKVTILDLRDGVCYLVTAVARRSAA